MRKILCIVTFAGVALLLVPMTPAHAGGPGRIIDITKVVEGDGPTGPYDFEAECTIGQAPPQTITFSLEDGETFPLALNGTDAASCTLAEVDDQGADSVAFDCTEDTGSASCDADDEVSFPAQVPGTASIVVTNTFDPEPTTTTTTAPSTTTTVAAAAPAAAAVVATPAFTG